jgi:hypothetical protein
MITWSKPTMEDLVACQGDQSSQYKMVVLDYKPTKDILTF